MYRNLHQFARDMIDGGRLALAPLPQIKLFEGCTEAVLYRDGPYQAELVVIPPNTSVRRHRHNRVSSVDLWLCGDIDGEIGGHRIKSQRGFGGGNDGHLFPIPRGVWHHGTAGQQGVIYVSLQLWDGKPGFISEDWEE